MVHEYSTYSPSVCRVLVLWAAFDLIIVLPETVFLSNPIYVVPPGSNSRGDIVVRVIAAPCKNLDSYSG